MSKIKILHITKSLGGIETYLRSIIEYIDKSKFEFTVIAPFSDSFKIFCEDHNVEIINIVRGRETGPVQDLKAIFKFRKIIKKTKPNFVHLHSAKAGFLGRLSCRLTKTRSIFTPHGLSYMSFTGFKRMVFFMFEVYAKRFTDRLLAVSYTEADRLIYELGIPASKIDVILNAISIKDIDDNIPKNFDRPKPMFKIGTIARLTYQKNPLLLVDVASDIISAYPNAEFFILGAGLEDHLKDQTVEKIKNYNIGDKFHILDWATTEEALEYLKSLDIFVLPSIFEGLPLSLLEAMSYRVPAVTSKCDGCNDVIQNNINGFACITREEYVAVISKLLDDKDLAKQIGDNGREYVKQKHNLKNSILLLEKLYLDFDRQK